MDDLTTKTESKSLAKNWGWLLALGILLVILGVWAAFYSVFVSVIAIVWLGILLLISGVFQIASQFIGEKRHDFWFNLLFGILSIILALWIFFRPLQATIALTWIIIIFLAAIGVIQIIYSLAMRKAQWGWVLFNGIIDLLLAILIWVHWPASGLWVIGLFISIQVILVGWMLIMFAIAAKQKAI